MYKELYLKLQLYYYTVCKSIESSESKPAQGNSLLCKSVETSGNKFIVVDELNIIQWKPFDTQNHFYKHLYYFVYTVIYLKIALSSAFIESSIVFFLIINI